MGEEIRNFGQNIYPRYLAHKSSNRAEKWPVGTVCLWSFLLHHSKYGCQHSMTTICSTRNSSIFSTMCTQISNRYANDVYLFYLFILFVYSICLFYLFIFIYFVIILDIIYDALVSANVVHSVNLNGR